MIGKAQKRAMRKRRILKLIFMLIPSASGRCRFIRKHHLFAGFGKDSVFQPHQLPDDTKCIRIGNNVRVAANVSFINHDNLHLLFNNKEHTNEFRQNLQCIDVKDNVLIGSWSVILPGVSIGPNAIVAAGSVVTKDVPEGTVVAGVPARVVGSFEKSADKQRKLSHQRSTATRFTEQRIAEAWLEFETAHKGVNGRAQHEENDS